MKQVLNSHYRVRFSAAAMAAAAAAAAAGQQGLHALMRPDLRDEKSALSSMDERLKHSSSSSPHSLNRDMRGRSPPPGMGSSSRSPSSIIGGDRRPGSTSGHHRSSTPHDEAHKRIKLDESARKAQHVSQE